MTSCELRWEEKEEGLYHMLEDLRGSVRDVVQVPYGSGHDVDMAWLNEGMRWMTQSTT